MKTKKASELFGTPTEAIQKALKPESAQHTPTPSRAELSTIYGPLIDPLNSDGADDPILSVINRADAAFIVRAVTVHEELLEAVKDMYSAITNGHSLRLTHEQYKELIAKAEVQ